MNKQTNKLTVDDFKGKDSISSLYEISDEDKKLLVALDESVKKMTKEFANKSIDFAEYSRQVSLLNDLTKSFKNIVIEANDKNNFSVYLIANSKESQDTVNPVIFSLYSIKWEESERGWGTRPDGFSFHRSAQEATDYIKAYWDKMPDETPDEYSRPCNDKPNLIQVSKSLHEYVVKNGSIWLFDTSADKYKTYDASQLGKK